MKTSTPVNHEQAEGDDDGRIRQRRLDLGAEVGVLLQVDGHPVERVVEEAARFAGVDHGDHQPWEHLVLLDHRARQ